MSTKAVNPRTKSWTHILDLMEAEAWPIPRSIARVRQQLADLNAQRENLPPLGERKSDAELGRILTESADPVAAMQDEVDAEARREVLRRTQDVLGNYSRHLGAGTLPRVIRESCEELFAVASEQAELAMQEARPHAELLHRFAERGYRHEDIMASGTPEELAAAQTVELLGRRFALAITLWTMAARSALSRAGGRAFDARPDLSGGVAWTHPLAATREELASPEDVRLVVAAVHPAGFSLPPSFVELKRRQDEADRARLKYRSDLPHVLAVDPSTLSDEVAA